MIINDSEPAIAEASLLCGRALPSTILATSRDVGWTSVLVDHHRVQASEKPFETVPTPDQTVVVMTRGEQEIEAFRAGVWRRATYRAGTIGMTAGGESDRLRRRVRQNAALFEKVNLYIPSRFFQDAADHYRRAGHRLGDEPLTTLAFHDPVVGGTVAALLRAMAAGLPNLYAQTATQWLATHLLSAHARLIDTAEDARLPGTISDKRLARVLEYMSAHFAEPLALEDLAAEAGISKFHFCRLFRASTGMTPHGFLIKLRMDTARRLLETTDLSVALIAAQCGFAGAAHFGAAFASRFGVAPTAFRINHRDGHAHVRNRSSGTDLRD